MGADAWVLGLHMATAHWGAPVGVAFDGANPGLYLRAPSGATAGLYRNSYGKPSAYAGWTWTTANGLWSLTAGGVTGYPSAYVSPMVVPSMRWRIGDTWAARIAYLHKPHSDGAYGLHLSVERAL